MITLAVQKSGRLYEHTAQLLKECGIRFENGGRDKLKAVAVNFPMKILYLRDDDIPECVHDRIADAGIVGENIFIEKKRDGKIIEKLGFARCRLSIAVPKTMPYENPGSLKGLKIATSYPNILMDYLDKNNLEMDIHEISGSVEIAPGIGLADVIFDIVSTGSTLMHNGLKEVETVMHSEAALIRTTEIDPEKDKILQQLLFRIRAVNKAKKYKYILLNIPNDRIEQVSEMLPGMKSPTVLPLAEAGWSSLHSVIEESKFWEIIENLKAAGAQGILVAPIEKMVI